MPASPPSSNTSFWIALSFFFAGPRLRKLFDYFPDGRAAWGTEGAALRACGFEATTFLKFDAWRRTQDPRALEERVSAAGIDVVMHGSEAYPSALVPLLDAPALLFRRGASEQFQATVAIVGSRLPSAYGRAVTTQLARDIASAGCTVVSGLARGTDGLAHEGAVAVGGRSIGVIGSGLDAASFYPREHWQLAERLVASGGCVFSEYPPGVRPAPHHFPERNRILAGLADVVVVIEAAEKSGALITAYQALEYGKDVAAVPGTITSPLSRGANGLLKRGAAVVTEAADILQLLGLEPSSSVRPPLTDDEQEVLRAFSETPQLLAEVVERARLSVAAMLPLVASLEEKEYLRDVGGGRYARTSRQS